MLTIDKMTNLIISAVNASNNGPRVRGWEAVRIYGYDSGKGPYTYEANLFRLLYEQIWDNRENDCKYGADELA